ncbi:hypothetical protein BD324DRAFT_652096 [Kockovaella imperatae]|uniref:Nudix hydrolase domain-containing protein n=1 Tax=Kockovaella imperatae TaxID=4999 RepID=A0A1Y1UEP9_9TREE|nr:hypothetical protein BD324DRAFT_652096 [Kockovaella imperatae]ORX35545.1 hypothetical protein BD324DRAFT_652096 [Kockovaella imperatae]
MPESIESDPNHYPKIQFRNPPFTFHRSLARFCIPLSKFTKLSSNQGKRIRASVVISEPYLPGTSNEGPGSSATTPFVSRLLVVQRSAHDAAFANNWELPGEHAEFGVDQTLLETVVRGTREKTGLRVTGIKRELKGLEYHLSGGGVSKQFVFWVDVQGLEGTRGVQSVQGSHMEGESMRTLIRLDPIEHQAWKWVSERDVDGLHTTAETKECILSALTVIGQGSK